MKKLYRTSLEIWSTRKPHSDETGGVIASLAEMNSKGDAYLALEKTVTVENPREDFNFKLAQDVCAISDWLQQFE